MSNRVSFIRTEFKDYSGTSYGFRVSDDYSQSYGNLLEGSASTDDAEFLQYVRENENDEISAQIEFSMENGAYIDAEFYDGYEFSQLLNGNEDEEA